MKVILFGASGMVGAGALREALEAREMLGRAMLRVAEGRADEFILESKDINRIGAAHAA